MRSNNLLPKTNGSHTFRFGEREKEIFALSSRVSNGMRQTKWKRRGNNHVCRAANDVQLCNSDTHEMVLRPGESFIAGRRRGDTRGRETRSLKRFIKFGGTFAATVAVAPLSPRNASVSKRLTSTRARFSSTEGVRRCCFAVAHQTGID